MALRIPEKISETVEIASYLDGAIDLEATGEERFSSYMQADDLDVSTLATMPNESLSLFTMQSLSEDQMALVSSDMQSNSALGFQTAARFSVRDFSGDEWKPRFSVLHGHRALTRDSFGQLDRDTQMFLGIVAFKVSSLGKLKG